MKMRRRFVTELISTNFLILVVGFWFGGGRADGSETLFEEIEQEYGISVLHGSDRVVFPELWMKEPISAGVEEIEVEELRRFPALLRMALSRYPKRVIKENLSAIALAKGYQFYDVGYGATYSPDMVYLSSDGIEMGYDDDYLVKSFHHEFSSILFNNFEFPTEKWDACNAEGFEYREGDNGGLDAVINGEDGLEGSAFWYRKGFLNQYSTSGLEEDFNSYSEVILTEPKKFRLLAEKYDAIGKKFEIWLSFYRSIDEAFNRQSLFHP